MSNILILGILTIAIGGIYSLGWTATGLIYDVFGISLLLELDSKGEWATLRYRTTGEGKHDWVSLKRKAKLWRLLPLWIARKCGSRNVMDMTQVQLDETIPIKAWALVLLFTGFTFQAVGNWMTR